LAAEDHPGISLPVDHKQIRPTNVQYVWTKTLNKLVKKKQINCKYKIVKNKAKSVQKILSHPVIFD
jgi:hypothetical protein